MAKQKLHGGEMLSPWRSALVGVCFLTSAGPAWACSEGRFVGQYAVTSDGYTANTNPYRISFGEGRDKMPDLSLLEDVASPFSEDHVFEHKQLTALMIRRHNGPAELFLIRGADPEALKREPLPPQHDEAGHPLWFDGTCHNLLRNWVRSFLRQERFDELELLFDEWSDPKVIGADGRPFSMDFDPVEGTDWDNEFARIARWRMRFPSSTAAALAEAEYWRRFAWDARGPGMAPNVTDHSWQLFYDRLSRAWRVLALSRKFAGAHPKFAEIVIDVLGTTGNAKALLNTYKKRFDGKPIDLFSAVAMTNFLRPRWGGSWPMLDDFIVAARDATAGLEGHGYYARLYSDIGAWEGDPDIFKYTLADWNEMRRGFEDLVGRYPHSSMTLNRFAVFACIAGDGQTYREVRKRIGDHLLAYAWETGFSAERCDLLLKVAEAR